MKKNIQIPQYVLKGITRNHRAIPDEVVVFGGDTETVNGEPHTLQVCHDGKTTLYYVTRQNILKTFLEHIDENMKRGQWAVVYFHNLSFDLPVLFKDEPPEIWNQSNFRIVRHKWSCFINCEKRFFAKFSKQRNKTVYIVDSFAYLPTSLERIGEMLKLKLKKLKKPDGLGDLPLRTKEFEEYAIRDAVIEEEFGKWIYKIHQMFNIRISVSLPQMASYIFRHKFLLDGDVLQFPPREVCRMALRSYHGGKNGMYREAGLYENVAEIDINSAYPWAMKQLPSFLKGEYVMTDKMLPQYCGVYKISGAINCPYNIFFDDEFKPVKGEFRDICVTGFEIEEALKYKEVRIDSLMGYVWIPDKTATRNPLGDYVDYFYEKKQNTPKEDPMYNFWKLAMNSLYGKFLQLVEQREVLDLEKKKPSLFDFKVKVDKKGKVKVEERVKTFRAGGLFHPFIATMITALARVKLHGLEHRFQAIHSATDSIKTLMPVTGCSDELGGYKLEVKGMCLMLRNKLYCHFDQHGELVKYALHGFQGRVGDLLDLVVRKAQDYKINHIYKVREALRLRKPSLTMMKGVEKKFRFDWATFSDRGFSYWNAEKDPLKKPRYFGKIKR